MKKTLIASALIAGTFLSAGVFAAQNETVNTQTNLANQGKNYKMGIGKGMFGNGNHNLTNSENFEKAQTALKNKDYSTWSTLIKDQGISKIVNTENKFNKLVEIEQLKEKIKTLSEEIGFTGGMFGMGKGNMGGKGIGKQMPIPMIDQETHEAVQKALENKDYSTWSKLMDGKGIAKQINTQEKFNLFVQMHTAIQNQDETTAKKIATQLGLPEKGKGNRGK